MKVGFEKIAPTPDYPTGASAEALANYSWASGANVVKLFKNELKTSLRYAQNGRCCFCRRLLYDDYATQLEHFVEKSQYEAYTFEILNLALTCGTCNNKKNGFTSSFSKILKSRSIPFRSPVLALPLAVGDPFPTDDSAFRWVHPHFHNYSDHIKVHRSWIFEGKTRVGTRTIRGIDLNEVGVLERRALMEKLTMREGRLSMLVAALSELSNHRANDVSHAIAKALKRRREKATTSRP